MTVNAHRARHAFTVQDPATGLPVAEVPSASTDDALAALTRAATAQPAWAATAPQERAAVLHRLDALLRAETEDLAALLTCETGKTLAEARGEVSYAADYVRWYAEEAVRPPGRSTVSPDGAFQIVTVAEPVGPCLLVTPWNAPLAMAARKVAPALAAGCTALLKPPDLAPLSSLELGVLLARAGLSDGVLSVLPTTEPAEMCRALTADPRLRKVSFTGSTEVGRQLIRQSADQVLRVSMELGGNAHLVVLDDADLDVAVEAAMVAKFRNAGQSCVAANVLLVHDAVADDFVARLGARVERLVVGDPTDPASDLGPLVDARAVAKATRLVDDALRRGARGVARTPVPEAPGHWCPAWLLDHVPPDAAIAHEEVFGPVAAVVRVSGEAEAVHLANRGTAGLAAYVISRDMARATRVGAALRAGMVGLNRGLVSSVAAPFGGVAQSGLGHEGGPEGLAEYLETKYYAVPWGGPR